MTQLLQTQASLRNHAKTFWGCSEQVAQQIKLSKIDVAVDMKGSFIPDHSNSHHKEIGELLGQAMTEIFQFDSLNFLSLNPISDLRVVRGENNLDTCYQYAVLDGEKETLLKVKVYDKTLDMIGRDGINMVGTRLDHILGSSG